MSYSWGEDSEATPLGGSGYDYASARRAYADPGEGGSLAAKRGKTPPPVGKELQTDTTHPIVVAVDVTGSMSSWPAVIFEKLPLLGQEVDRYTPDYAISFAAVGDAYCDSEPLQVRDFDSGPALDQHIRELYPEGGGGDAPESYDLAAYYYLNHCRIDQAVLPLFIFILDAPNHEKLQPEAIQRFTGDTVNEPLDSRSLIRQLAKKFIVYVVLKDFRQGSPTTRHWQDLVGAPNVLPFEEPRDIVEVLIGIVAAETGAFEDFKARASERHADKPDRVIRVMVSLKSVSHKRTAAEGGGASAKAVRSRKSGEAGEEGKDPKHGSTGEPPRSKRLT